MDVEHDVKVVKIGPDFQKDVDQLTADGWKLFPGSIPVAIYPMFREKHAEAQPTPAVFDVGEAHGELVVNDELVGILRSNGKFERF